VYGVHVSSSPAPDVAPRRPRLNREQVLRAAVQLADDAGIEALSMRHLAQRIGVVPMALYKHVAGKAELLDGMVDVIVGDIDLASTGSDWKRAVRQQVLSARRALLRHPWALQVIESRTSASPVVLDYMNALIGLFRAGGFSVDLTHHAMHALGTRMWGFTWDVFPTPTPPADPAERAAMLATFAERYPHIVEMATAASHDEASTVGGGCDDQFEFEFTLDLMLDGFEALHRRGWTSTVRS
jgi:AcrR family transcriptional regulator